MTLTITIAMDNAAFTDESNGFEVARILRTLAMELDGSILQPGDKSPAMDVNGNRVGQAVVTA